MYIDVLLKRYFLKPYVPWKSCHQHQFSNRCIQICGGKMCDIFLVFFSFCSFISDFSKSNFLRFPQSNQSGIELALFHIEFSSSSSSSSKSSSSSSSSSSSPSQIFSQYYSFSHHQSRGRKTAGGWQWQTRYARKKENEEIENKERKRKTDVRNKEKQGKQDEVKNNGKGRK